MTITNKTQTIEINGKKYINTSLFMKKFNYENSKQVKCEIKKGLPCIIKDDKPWFNEDLCYKWFAGVI